MTNAILLDVAPDPVLTAGSLIALGILIVGVVTIFVLALVFVLFWLKRRKATATPASNQPSSPNPSSPNQ